MATPTAPTVADLLAAPGLRLHLVAGDAWTLQRPVRWVHTTELPAPGAYLRGGELVCTVGVNLTAPDACGGFAAAVAAAGAVAVCFGVGDVHPAVPTALVQACTALGLPLLELPAGAPFLAVGEHLADRWSALGEAELLREDHVVDALLAAAVAGDDEPALVDLAGDLTGGRVTVSTGSPSRVRWTAPDTVPPTSPPPSPPSPPSETLLAHLAGVLDLARHHRDVQRRAGRARAGELLELVADGLADAAAVGPLLVDAGLGDLDLLTVAAWPRGSAQRWVDQPRDVVIGDTGAAVLTVTRGRAAATALAAASGLVCGIGPDVAPARLAQSIAGARTALVAAERTGRVAGPESLTTLTALLEQQPAELLAPFVDQVIRPLVGDDRRHGHAQLDTLRAFLADDGSLQRTARHQFVHVNTVRHRLERVRALTGRDPFTFAGRSEIAIALWAYDHSGSNATSLGAPTGRPRA